MKGIIYDTRSYSSPFKPTINCTTGIVVWKGKGYILDLSSEKPQALDPQTRILHEEATLNLRPIR